MLDLHFSHTELCLFAVATSTGSICLFKFEALRTEPINHLQTIDIAAPSILVLSLAWCPSTEFSSTIAASLSDGRIATFHHDSPRSSLKAAAGHSLEAWTLAWSADVSHPLQLYSGGDDSAICQHNFVSDQIDRESSEDNERAEYRPPLHCDSKIHMAGVTAILPLCVCDEGEQETILTGSYDEYIRVLTIGRFLSRKRFQVLAEKRLHGGVWRLKFLGSTVKEDNVTFTILASCMHAGARIMKIHQLKGDEWSIEVVSRFEEHESMNYGSDACPNPIWPIETFTIVSTSFYDRKLCVWKYEEP